MKKKDSYRPVPVVNRYSSQFRFYNGELKKHGPLSAQAVGWSEFIQDRLFYSLSRLFDDSDKTGVYTLLDIGCGLGDFVSFLQDERISHIKYTGIDFIPDMVRYAKKKHPGRSFFVRDFMDRGFQIIFDYLVCSGALNIINYNSEEKHVQYIKRFIRKMYRLGNRGIALNLLSRRGAEYLLPDSRFYLANPDDIYSFCRKIDSDAEMDHSSYEFSFTIYMRKQKTYH